MALFFLSCHVSNLLTALLPDVLLNNCIAKGIVGDEAFFSDEFNEYYKFHGIKALPRTPWPNRAETAVRLFKRQGDERFNGVTMRQAVKMTVWARNTQLTISGYSPLEVATGRVPPDLFDVETANPEQLSATPPDEDKSTLALQRLALFIPFSKMYQIFFLIE